LTSFDVSGLSQAAARKITPHDNCLVLDLGTGSFPRDIEVRLLDDDGARQIAIWDGALDLAINDEVLCHEYAGSPKWRLVSVGGNDSGAGKQRVSKVWESDFGAIALQADAVGNVGVATSTPSARFEVEDGGTPGVIMKVTADDQSPVAIAVGNDTYNSDDIESLAFWVDNAGFAFLRMGSATPKPIILQPSFGSVGIGITTSPTATLDILAATGAQLRLLFSATKFADFAVDTNHDLIIKPSSTGQIKLQPTTDSIDFFQVLDADGGDPMLNADSINERIGIRTAAPEKDLHIKGSATSSDVVFENETRDTKAYFALSGGNTAQYAINRDITGTFSNVNAPAANMNLIATTGNSRITFSTGDTDNVDPTQAMIIDKNQQVGIGTGSPSTRLDVDNGAIEFAEMTAPGAGAANTARLFARDDGGGDTEFCVRFNSGLIQVIAPLEFGEVSILNNTSTTVLAAATPAQFLFFDTNGPSNGATPDHTNDHITVNKAGTYLVTCSVTTETTVGGGITLDLAVMKNNGATQVGAVHAHRDMAGGGGDVGSISMSGLAVLSSGDTIELWVENETNGNDIILEDATLSIAMVGVNA
jgi:hypothetical protein